MKITIPTTLSDITLGQWMRWQKLIKEESQDETVLSLFLVAIFCNITSDEALQIKSKDLKEISNDILQVLQSKPRDLHRFTTNSKEFGRIPNLDDMTSGEYRDLDTYFDDPENLDRAMAVLFRPITNKQGANYLIEKYKGSDVYRETMANIPLEIFFSSQVFFYNLSKELLTATKDYLQSPKAEELEQALQRNGAGIHHLTQYLKDAELRLSQFLN
jgi:hypothetical protein